MDSDDDLQNPYISDGDIINEDTINELSFMDLKDLNLLCDKYITIIERINEIKKELKKHKDNSLLYMDEIGKLFNKFQLTQHKYKDVTFSFNTTQRKKLPKPSDIKKVIENIVDNENDVKTINTQIDSLTQVVDLTKIKCKKK